MEAGFFVNNLIVTQLYYIRKTASIFLKMEDDLNILENGRQPHFFLMEDNINNFTNGRRSQYFFNGRRP